MENLFEGDVKMQIIYVQVARDMFELNESKFNKLEEFFDEFDKLYNGDFDSINFNEVCDYVLRDIIPWPVRRFYEKYIPFVKKNLPTIRLMRIAADDDYPKDCYTSYILEGMETYHALKENYSSDREGLLEKFNRLLEIGIKYFDYLPNKDIDGDYEMSISNSLKECIATDGEMTFGIPKYVDNKVYPLSINGAKYIIKYDKENDGNYMEEYFSYLCYGEMVVRDLSFDINTLPTYEEMYDFETDLRIDHEVMEYLENLLKQKNKIVGTVEKSDGIIDIMDRLLRELEYFNNELECTKDMEEAKRILEKIDVVKELYTDVIALRTAIVDSVVNDEKLMTEEEIGSMLQKRKEHRS